MNFASKTQTLAAAIHAASYLNHYSMQKPAEQGSLPATNMCFANVSGHMLGSCSPGKGYAIIIKL